MKKRGRKPSFQKLRDQQHLMEILELYRTTPIDEFQSNEQKFFKSLIDKDGYATEEEMNYDVFNHKGKDAGVRVAMRKLWNLGYPIYSAQYGEIRTTRRGSYYKQCYYLELDPVWVKKLEIIKPLIDKDKMNYEVALTRYLRKFPERNMKEEYVTIPKSIFFELNKMDVSKKDKTKLWEIFKQNETTLETLG